MARTIPHTQSRMRRAEARTAYLCLLSSIIGLVCITYIASVSFKTPSAKKREMAWDAVCTVLLIALALIVMFQIYWIARSALMSNAELYAYPPSFLPPQWRFDNFSKTSEVVDYWLFLGNALTILAPSVIGAVITATMGGYAFARLRFRGKNCCLHCVLVPCYSLPWERWFRCLSYGPNCSWWERFGH